jgi:hypothetical protein
VRRGGLAPSEAPPTVRRMAMCHVCRRTLLTGERFRVWVERQSRQHTVCLLCEGEALELRWLRPDLPVERVNATGLARTVRRVA